jgi:hypothetical protein
MWMEERDTYILVCGQTTTTNKEVLTVHFYGISSTLHQQPTVQLTLLELGVRRLTTVE